MTQIRTFAAEGKALLEPSARAVLQELGTALDQHRRLLVRNRGIVVLDAAASAKEDEDERQGKTRSTARSRERAARRERTARRSRPAGPAPRLLSDELRANYEGQVIDLRLAYPSLETFYDDDGMWLLVNSSVVPDLKREATFLIGVPFRPGLVPRAWAFWTADGKHQWIGPRHTNFGDGSICAFSPDDGVWHDGGNLATLLDIYTVWALRQLHLEAFGRWPGKQYSLGGHPMVQAYYRLRETHDDELCSCGSETKKYAECCKPLDAKLSVIEVLSKYQIPDFKTRRPPTSVVASVAARSPALRIVDAFPQAATLR